MKHVYQWDEENPDEREQDRLLKGRNLTAWRRKQVKRACELMRRADEITGNDRSLEQYGKMPANEDEYKQRSWLKARNHAIGELLERFDCELDKLRHEYPELASVQVELREIEDWDDI